MTITVHGLKGVVRDMAAFLALFAASQASAGPAREPLSLERILSGAQAKFDAVTSFVSEKLGGTCSDSAPAIPPSVREQSRDIVDRCAATVLPSDYSANVSYVADQPDEPCNAATGERHGTRVDYSVQKLGDGIHVGLDVGLMLPTAPSADGLSQGAILQNMRACIPRIQQVWERYGVRFDLTFDEEKPPFNMGESGKRNARVWISDDRNGGRSNSSTIYYYGLHGVWSQLSCYWVQNMSTGKLDMLEKPDPGCLAKYESQRQDELCLVLLHETGHLVGLPDEYADAQCPDRTEVRQYPASAPIPVSVMDDQWQGWDYIEFFPNDVQRVIEPLCPGAF